MGGDLGGIGHEQVAPDVGERHAEVLAHRHDGEQALHRLHGVARARPEDERRREQALRDPGADRAWLDAGCGGEVAEGGPVFSPVFVRLHAAEDIIGKATCQDDSCPVDVPPARACGQERNK
jgi:hypothetical protein